MKKYFVPVLSFFIVISFNIFSIYWFVILHNFNEKVKELKSNLYFVPLDPGKADEEDWMFLNDQEWIHLKSIDVSNFSFVYWSMLVNDDDPENLHFYTDKNILEIETIYKDQLKNSILQLAIYFSSLKYITYTEEFADYIIDENSRIVLGSSGTHYYFSPYGIYDQDRIQKTTGENGNQAKVNPLELLIEYRNANYDLTIAYKLPEWIYMDYVKNNSVNYSSGEFQNNYSKTNFKNYDSFYESVLGVGSTPDDSPVIDVTWDENTFSSPNSLTNNGSYDGYIFQRNNLFGDSSYIRNDNVMSDSNNVKHTPNNLKDAEVVMHEIGHNLGYKHTTENKYYDSIYWAGETYQEIYDLTFKSKQYDEKMTVSDWFMNNINMDTLEGWEEYNLYSYLWNYQTDNLGDLELTNYYYSL